MAPSRSTFVRQCVLAGLLFCLASGLAAQSIFTVAGGGSDDGQRATDIALNGPRGLAFDPAGYLFVAERFQGIVRRINTTTGVVETIAGIGASGYGGDNGPAKRATLREPRSLFRTANGDLYIADYGNGRVRKIDATTGIITTVAGRGDERSDGTIGDGGPATEAVLRGPWGIWIDRGNLYITENGYLGMRVRRVALATGTITTVAGRIDGEVGFEGDGGPALQARFKDLTGIAIDSAGNIFLADSENNRVRRIDAATGNIETYAGGGQPATGSGDGGPATSATLNYPTTMSFDPNGNLLIGTIDSVRIVDRTTRIINTVVADTGIIYGLLADSAGNIYISSDGYYAVLRLAAGAREFTFFAGLGDYIGDGLLATSAVLRSPLGLAVDAAGNLFLADAQNLVVRRVDAATGVITTVAGNHYFYDNDEGDGKSATSVAMYPIDVAIGPDGNLYIADAGNNRIKRVDLRTGILTFFAGGGNPPGGNNEGLPATQARLGRPHAIAFDSAGNLFIADRESFRVWRIDSTARTITAIAGNGQEGSSGNGGPARDARIIPNGVAVDRAGNVYISDIEAIRKVSPDGMISAFAGLLGRGSFDGFGDGGPAIDAFVSPKRMAYHFSGNALYFADEFTNRIRKIDLNTSIITTVAGSGTANYFDSDFQGDNGPAKAAKMNFGYDGTGIAIRPSGDLYLSDTSNNRVRAMFACRTIAAPALAAPAEGATGVATAPALSWNPSEGAFRYDVFLDTISDPQRLVASDIDETAYTPSNLTPNTRYYWKIRAKGDPFCDPVSTAISAVRSFTTSGRCGVSSFDLVSPADGATNVSPLVLTWQPAAGAGSYDVYFGNVNPPPLYRSGVTQTSLQVTGGSGTHYWTVIARASCDPNQTSSPPVRSFTPSAPATCTGPATVTPLAPADLATDIAATVELTWRADGCAAAPFSVYFGTQPEPPLLAAEIVSTSQRVDALAPSTTYYWRVIGTNVNGGRVSSPTVRFTTRGCATPGQPTITFAPATISAGGTYTIVWSPASGLDASGGYLVDRSTSSSFTTSESQITTTTAASFIAGSPGTWYHRVRAIPSCDPTRLGPASDVRQVVVTNARPNVIFTVQPAAVVSALGERLEDKVGSFTLENIGTNPVRIAYGRQELNGSPPFFTIFDPQGNDLFVTLQPRTPHTFQIRYSGPRNDVRGSYQGVIYVAGEGLSVIPYAFVDLRVGESGGASPQFLVNGVPSEYVAFPGRSGDDTGRPPVTVSIRNNGTTPMELAAEIGPEVWLVPERGWNDGRVEPNASRSVNLFTRRVFAPNGSALPRYTYFTVRTKDGASARLLVQDNDAIQSTRGRNVALPSGERSFVVPELTSRLTSAGSLIATRLRLTNAGTEAVQTELIFTPSATDGFDANGVRRAVVIVPANDVVTLTDPLTQVFALTRPAAGQLEIRIPVERLGLVSVTASTVAIDGNRSIAIPTVNRGDGARLNLPHTLFGATENSSATTALVLAETSGIDGARVRVTLFDPAGSRVGESVYELRRYGYLRVENIVTALGGSTLEYGRIDLAVESGSGSVTGVAIVRDRNGESGATFVSRASDEGTATTRLLAQFAKGGPVPHATIPSITTVVPVLSTPASAGTAPAYRTVISFAATTATSANFKAVLKGINGAEIASTPPIDVPRGTTLVLKDAPKDLFGAAAAPGSIFVEATGGGKVYALLQATSASFPGGAPSASIPLPTTVSEVLSSASGSMQRPLLLDGLEQSTDPSRGNRWMLLVNEVSGQSGTVRVSLYEAGNRTSAIAQKDIAVSAYQQATLDTVFAELGLDAADRRKDRANVQVVVTAVSGGARVAASAVSIDNRTGDTKMHSLAPSAGSGSTGTTLVTAVPPPPPTSQPGRRRATRR